MLSILPISMFFVFYVPLKGFLCNLIVRINKNKLYESKIYYNYKGWTKETCLARLILVMVTK